MTDEIKKQWVCPSCTCSRPKVSDTSTPIRTLNNSFSTGNINTTRGNRTKSGTSTTRGGDESSTSAVLEEIRLLRQDILELKTQLSNVSTNLDQRVSEFEKRLNTKDLEINDLKSTLLAMQDVISSQEQQQLRNELEIVGIPERNHENLMHLILVSSKKLGVDLQESDVDQVKRVGSKQNNTVNSGGETRPVVVKLVRKHKRDELLSAASKRRGLTSSDLVSGTSSALYFNERLSKANRRLFGEARKRAKLNNFRFCWIRNGNILVRKAQSSNNKKYPVLTIRSFEDIDKTMGSVGEAASEFFPESTCQQS